MGSVVVAVPLLLLEKGKRATETTTETETMVAVMVPVAVPL